MTSKATAAAFLSHRNELARLEESCLRILSSCNSNSSTAGLHVHSPIIKLGLLENLDFGNNLLCLYSKTDGIWNARKLFDEMPQRDVFSWNFMISTYTKSQQHGSTLEMFDEMTASSTHPNELTFPSVIRSCSGLGDLGYGARVHCIVIKSGFEANPIVCSSLIYLYSKCNMVKEARELFGSMESHDTVAWTTMISTLVEARRWSEALGFYTKMIKAEIPPNEFTFVKLLAAASFIGLEYGELLHAHIIIRGVLLNVVPKTSLVDFYSRFSRMDEAVKVLNSTHERDVFLWTAVVSGFARNLRCKEAVDAFIEMQRKGFKPNNFTYSAVSSLCCSVQSLDLGKQIHSRTIKVGFSGNDDVGNALVDMYMKCSSTTAEAQRVFREMSSSNVVSWTALISGLVDHGFEQDCFGLLMEMVSQGVQPNAVTLIGVLRACSQAKSARWVPEIHGYILRRKLNGEIIIGNSLVDAYASSDMADYAWNAIRMMNSRDSITYTSMATRLNELGNHETALSIIEKMIEDGIRMDQYSLAGFISASANVGALEIGKHLHCCSVKSGFSSGVSVLNSLVDMYGKCGYPGDAKRAFDEIKEPDVISWNGLISGLKTNGCISSALSAFEDMRMRGTEPDPVTFLLVMSACSNSKLTQMGLEYFKLMRETHKIKPQIDHYAYLVDLLGQAGRLEEAVEVVETMPLKPNAIIFKTLLRACRFHRNLPLGEDMASRGLALAPFDPAFYILLSYLYDESGKPELAQKARKLMREQGLSKKPSQSSVEVHGKVCKFIAGDATSSDTTNEIHRKIKSVKGEFERLGYTYHDNPDARHHTAKQAVAFGLIYASPWAAIHVVKNKTLCKDCHNFMSLVSRVVSRHIIVRDGNRVHTFENGECSCKDGTSFV